MKNEIFAVFDKRINSYLPVFTARNGPDAIRNMQGLLYDGKHMFARHPGDFTLCTFGSFDDSNGEFKIHPPQIVCEIISCLDALHEGGEVKTDDQYNPRKNGSLPNTEVTSDG